MSSDADWRYYRNNLDGLYVPYAYADEHVEMDEDTANGIKDGLFFVFDLAAGIRTWAPVAASIVLVALCYSIAAVDGYTDTDKKGDNLLSPLLVGEDMLKNEPAQDPEPGAWWRRWRQ